MTLETYERTIRDLEERLQAVVGEAGDLKARIAKMEATHQAELKQQALETQALVNGAADEIAQLRYLLGERDRQLEEQAVTLASLAPAPPPPEIDEYIKENARALETILQIADTGDVTLAQKYLGE